MIQVIIRIIKTGHPDGIKLLLCMLAFMVMGIVLYFRKKKYYGYSLSVIMFVTGPLCISLGVWLLLVNYTTGSFLGISQRSYLSSLMHFLLGLGSIFSGIGYKLEMREKGYEVEKKEHPNQTFSNPIVSKILLFCSIYCFINAVVSLLRNEP